MDFEVVIAGGGLASARAIKSYREEGGSGRILLVSKDTWIPYHRPPLSKKYFRGESEARDALVEGDDFYAANDVELELESEVESVDPDAHVVTVEGRRVEYGKLLLATGAWPRRLPVPGADLANVFTLRTLDDSTAIRDAAKGARRAVVVGAGFIGMETAASLRALGVEVALVAPGALYGQFRVPEVSSDLAELYRSESVELVLGDSVSAFSGDGHVSSVETESGRTLEADLVITGIGVVPVTDFLDGSGIDVDDGIVVDAGFSCSAPDVYAAGDVAAFFDPLYDKRRRIEHWSNSNYQGTEVGKILAGADGGYDTLSTFFTEVFGKTMKLFGDSTEGETTVVRGSLLDDDVVAFFLDGEDRLVATLVSGQDDETESGLKELVKARPRADRDALADAATSIDDAFTG